MIDLTSILSWGQFLVLLISIITVGLKVGRFLGTQEQINKNQEETNKRFDCDIKAADQKIEDVKYDLGDKIDRVKDDLTKQIKEVGDDVEYIKGKFSKVNI